jgi:hypothetical protein
MIRRRIHPIAYTLRQSTDVDAFTPLTVRELTQSKSTISNAAFGALSSSKSGLSTQEVRERSLANVKERMTGRVSGGRMRGKVGVITGVGPVAGIGVSQGRVIAIAKAVGPELTSKTAAARIYAREGAAHLYLLDFNGEALPGLAAELEQHYPAMKVYPMLTRSDVS